MLREEPLKLVQAALEVKNLFGGFGDLDLKRRSFAWREVRFMELGCRGRAQIFVESGGESEPEVLGDENDILLRALQIQHVDCDFLLRGEGGYERRAGRGFMEGKRRLKNFLKQIPALAELVRSRRGSLREPGLELRIDQRKPAKLPNAFVQTRGA